MVNRRDFLKYTVAVPVIGMPLFSLYGCNNDGNASQYPEYPIDSTVSTTLQRTIKPGQTSGAIAAQDLKQISQYDQNGYGAWSYSEPLVSEKRTDIMSAGYAAPASNNHTEKLLRFFAITDIHITDKESPSQLIYMQPLNKHGDASHAVEAAATSVYSPTMMYTTHVLDAAVQTVNALHKQSPIDFGISLGDTCNSTQYNELRWYIDVLDGKVITPSSGAHVGADNIDYQKPFQAAGLDPAIPWYQAIGNHDHFWLGSIPPDVGDMRKTCISDEVLAIGNLLANGNNVYDKTPPLYYMGVIDGTTKNGEIIKYGAVENFSSPPKVVADNDRRSLTKAEWVSEYYKTSTSPVGHGLNLVPAGQEAGFACYSFVPKSNLPIKVIVLDNTQREDDGSASIHGHGFLDQARWNWLRKELADGDAADQLMIIAAHIPIGVQAAGSFMEWFDNSANPGGMQNAVNLQDLIAELNSHPNLLMFMAGHRHVNAVKAFASPDPVNAPENGFWQVETSSLHDFPQQLRTFEISLNSDYTISINTTNVDPAVKEGTPAWTARKYAVAAQQIVNNKAIYQADTSSNYLVDPVTQAKISSMDPSIHPMPSGSYNAELFKQLSPKMKAKMQSLFPTL